jgi:uncharacterized protein RhaS with RHS repeats
LNTYSYPTNPVGWVDPEGLQIAPPTGGSAAGAGFGGLGGFGAKGKKSSDFYGMTDRELKELKSLGLGENSPNTYVTAPFYKNDPDALTAGHHAAKGNQSDSRYGGNCSPNQYNLLAEKYKEFCKGKYGAAAYGKCWPWTSVLQRGTAIDIWTQCAKAREDIARECFAGGDKTHRDEIDKAWAVVKGCGGTQP